MGCYPGYFGLGPNIRLLFDPKQTLTVETHIIVDEDYLLLGAIYLILGKKSVGANYQIRQEEARLLQNCISGVMDFWLAQFPMAFDIQVIERLCRHKVV